METYRVVAYMGDNSILCAICTDMKYAEKAKKLILERGFDSVEIAKMDYLLNTMEIDGNIIDLTEYTED